MRKNILFTLLELKRKVRTSEDREASNNKKLIIQKEKLSVLSTKLAELTVQNELFRHSVEELGEDKTKLEKELEELRKEKYEMDAKYQDQIQQMEKQLQRRSRVFRPTKKKSGAIFEAFAEKVDFASHIQGLKKTGSRFLAEAKQVII